MKQTLESVLLTRKISDEINNMTFHHHYSVLYDIAKEFGNSLINYVEIGCFAGGSACLMLQRPNTNVISIDTGEHINPEIVQQNVNKLNTLGNQYNYIQANSQKQETADQLKTLVDGIDILFIDGDHSYEGVINDFNFYSNLVKPGCYIVFDDYNDIIHSPQVKLAVDDLLRNNSDYEIIGTLPNIFEARPSDLKEGNCFIIKKNKGITYPIVFPTYQRPDGLSEFYIRRLLDSIYAQSYQDFEVYMIGDKYSDQEQFDQIAKSYDHRIKAVNLPYAKERDKYEDVDKLWSSGGTNAMNTGIEMAKRDGHSFICLQNHDDFYYPNYLEEVNRCIKITGADFVFTKGHFTNGEEFPSYSLPNDKDYHEIYPHCGRVLTPTVCMNFAKMPLLFRDVYEETGNISPSDCDLWERVREYMVSHSLRSVFINKVLVSHPDEGYTKRSIEQIKEIKKLILISSHCDSEEKRKVLKTNLELLKETKIPIFLYASIHMEEDIINLVDFYFFNPNNPLGEDSSNLFWKEELYREKKIKFFRFWRNNRFAAFSQILKLVQLSRILNYDINYFMLYDLVIENQILNFIKDKNQESFFSFRATENGKELINDCATQFFSVSQSKLENLESEFIWERCLEFDCAEHFWADLAQKINVPINRDFIVEDHIYTFRNWQEDFFNYSPWKEFKIYFSKNIGTTDPQHCLIYDVKQPVEIFVRIDNDIKKISIMEETQFEIKPNYQKFEFWRDGKIYDVIDKAEKFPGGGWEFL